MTLKSVVFPEPFAPISPRISPPETCRSTSRTAATPPNDLETRSIVRRLSEATPELSIAPGGGRVGDGRYGHLLGPHDDLLAALPLVCAGEDLARAVGVELHGPLNSVHV